MRTSVNYLSCARCVRDTAIAFTLELKFQSLILFDCLEVCVTLLLHLSAALKHALVLLFVLVIVFVILMVFVFLIVFVQVDVE